MQTSFGFIYWISYYVVWLLFIAKNNWSNLHINGNKLGTTRSCYYYTAVHTASWLVSLQLSGEGGYFPLYFGIESTYWKEVRRFACRGYQKGKLESYMNNEWAWRQISKPLTKIITYQLTMLTAVQIYIVSIMSSCWRAFCVIT